MIPDDGNDAIEIAISGAEVISYTATGTLEGVEVVHISGACSPGEGMMRATGDGLTLSWKAPGDSGFGTDVAIEGDGEYVLLSADESQWIKVEVYTSWMPGGPQSAAVQLHENYANGVAGDDVTSAQASGGHQTNLTFTAENKTGRIMTSVRFWLTAAAAAVGFELSTDGVSWSAPTSEGAAIYDGTLSPGTPVTFHIRRTIAASTESDPHVTNQINYSFNV
jgi:hypothetical protein